MSAFPAVTSGEQQIGLREVEAQLALCSHVREAFVREQMNESGETRLIAYIVPSDDAVSSLADDLADEKASGQSSVAHVSRWQRLYDQVYDQPCSEDPAFNITGWNSSYSGDAIPEEEMREWVDATVERISLRGCKRVLEIGCGTGLLLSRLAGQCAVYTATDFSQVALDRVRQLIARRHDLHHVELLQRRAEDFGGIARAGYDTVILNSVVQYFPSIGYLQAVLRQCVSVLEPGGRIFLGDIRNLSQLRALHTSVRCHRESDDADRARLSRLIDQDVANESELVIDPDFFLSLAVEDRRISDIEILMKRGHFQNELTRFRYDAFLHVLATERVSLPDAWLDWERDRLTLAQIGKRLALRPPVLGVRGVPNARLASTVSALHWLTERAAGVATLGEWRAAQRPSDAHLEPEALWSIAEANGYVLECGIADDEATGRFDALFVDRPLAGNPRKVLWPRTASPTPRPSGSYANMPLKAALVRELTPRIRAHLGQVLPDHMMPSAFVFLDELPPGQAMLPAVSLPAQPREAPAGGPAAASSPLQAQLAKMWAQVLGVDSVGVREDFFDLGGDSFMAMKLVLLIQSELGWKTSVMELFAHPTVEALAQLAAARPDERPV